jgi:hypothetical protein
MKMKTQLIRTYGTQKRKLSEEILKSLVPIYEIREISNKQPNNTPQGLRKTRSS